MIGGDYDALDMIEYAMAKDYTHQKMHAVYKCAECEEWILEGETYYEICGFKVCESCVKNAMNYA